MQGLLQGKTALITGASRGIGRAIALKLASEGANIIIAAKSTEEDPRLGGTIHSVAKEVEEAGGKALAVYCDIRDEALIQSAVEQGTAAFGGLDFLINNASAINLSGTERLEAKRLDLMLDINVRGTFLVTQHCLSWLKQSDSARIVTLSPPLNLDLKWFSQHVAYTLSKYNMTMLSLGWSKEFARHRIAVNTLWPATTIATAAVQNLLGGDRLVQRSRKPKIMAEAAFHLLQQPVEFTGQTLLDEDVLRAAGISDFSGYAVNPEAGLQPDLFL